MEKDKLRQLIQDYLEKARILQIATANDNQPWVCTVYFATDNNLNVYWISTPSRRHSEELRRNEKVAGTIVLPHIPGDKVRGLQFEGTAKELIENADTAIALEFYSKRYGMSKERVDAILQKKDEHLPYVIKPNLFVLFDELNFPENPRQEYFV